MFGENQIWLRLLSENYPHNPCETLLHPKSLVISMFKASASPFWQTIGNTWNKIYTQQLSTHPDLRWLENINDVLLPLRKNSPHPPITTLDPNNNPPWSWPHPNSFNNNGPIADPPPQNKSLLSQTPPNKLITNQFQNTQPNQIPPRKPLLIHRCPNYHYQTIVKGM